MKTIQLTIDGTTITAHPGETILEVVRRQGWDERVPTLCYEPDLPPYTSCFVCVIEQEGVGKLLPACSTPVAEGMVLHTRSERVTAARKTALELLLSNHPADCVAPCKRGCPAGVDVQTYLWQAEAGEYLEAVKTIRKRNPLPIVCGRVCVRRCEDDCRRGILDEPVGINMVKRMASDNWVENPYEETPAADTGKSVAIVGSGPAGLTAAYYLRMAGHAVTLFEMRSKLGGMLRWGIPDYRLPQDLLDWEIQQILDLGVEVKMGVEVGKDITVDQLRKEHHAVFLTIGAQAASAARIKGEDHPAVVSGLDFLIGVKLGQADDFAIKGRKVAVVGGGNTAIDAARTALRLGASHVSILYRRTRKEMPANVEEIEAAEHEGIRLEFLIAPIGVEAEGDKLLGLTCQKMQLGEPDASGRRRPVPVENSDHLARCDIVIGAIGQKVEMGGVRCDDTELSVSRWGTINADEYSMATSVPGVFSGGDCMTGPSVAIDAIGHGRKAALSIHQYLEIGEPARILDRFSSRRENFGEIPAEDLPPAAAWPRAKQPHLDLAVATTSFEESELSLQEKEAEKEARRCLACGCAARGDCDLRELADEYGLDDKVTGQTRRRKIDYSHPHIVLDPNKCILCTRCIRTCGDVLGVSALGLVDRGFETIMQPALGKDLVDTDCISCGNCIEVCPTGALSFKSIAQTAPKRIQGETVCVLCPEVCAISASRNEYGVAVGNHKRPNGGRDPICAKGRYENVTRYDENRVKGPMARENGVLKPVSYQAAVSRAIEGLREAGERHGKGAVLFGSGGTVASEEAALLARIGRGFGAVAGSLSLAHTENGTLHEGSTLSGEQLEKAAWILVVGDDPMERNPVSAARLRRAVRKGARIAAITAAPTALTGLADFWCKARKGSEGVALGWLLRALGGPAAASAAACTDEALEAKCGVQPEHAAALLDLLRSGDGSLVGLYVPGTHGAAAAVNHLSALVGELRPGGEGSGILVARSYANVQGLLNAGLVTPEGTAAIAEGVDEGKFRAAWLLEEEPKVGAAALRNATFLVVQSTTLSGLAQRADVVFPATTNLEAGGTFVAWDGRSFNHGPVLPLVPEKSTLEVLEMVAAALGL